MKTSFLARKFSENRNETIFLKKNAAALRSILEKYEDGDLAEGQVSEIFSHLENLQKQSSRSVADWKRRFGAMGNKKAA